MVAARVAWKAKKEEEEEEGKRARFTAHEKVRYALRARQYLIEQRRR